MDTLFALLFLAAIICLVAGLIKPNLFSRVFKKPNRKLIGLVFGLMSLVFFILFGIFAPEVEKKPTAQKTSTPSATATETVKPTETPAPSPTPSPEPSQAPEKTTMDKLWETLDSTIKTREGFDIVYNEEDGFVRITKEPDDYINETYFVKQVYQEFVKYGLVAYSIDGVDDVEFLYWNNFTDQYGKTEREKGVDIAMKKDEFNKYDWKNLVGQNIYRQMTTSCYEHYIHLGVMKNLDTDRLTLLTI